MVRVGRGQLPDGDWIKTDEAADILSRATGRDIDADTLRRWIRHDDWRVAFLDVWQPGREYLINRERMLDDLEQSANLVIAVIAEERAKRK